MIRFKNWEMNNKGKTKKQILYDILEMEKGRMKG